jgi:hypothetical protein
MVKISAKLDLKKIPQKKLSCSEILSSRRTKLFILISCEDTEEGYMPFGSGFELFIEL